MCDRVLIVGQAPGRQAVGMEPWIHTRSGQRLAAMLGVPTSELLSVVDGANILDRPPVDRGGFAPGYRPAVEAGERLLVAHANRRIVACGRAVAWALGCRHRPALLTSHLCRLVDGSERTIALLPHPSGANRWWNDPLRRDQATRWLRSVVHGRLRRTA